MAVLRERSEIVVFDVDSLLADPDDFDTKTIENELVGSVELSVDGQRAVLFTTAVDSDRLTIVETSVAGLPTRTVSTETPVAAVRTSPDGLHAVALGKASAGTATGSFTIVALADERFPRVVGTKAPVLDAALDNTAGVVTTSDEKGVFEAYLILHAEPQRGGHSPGQPTRFRRGLAGGGLGFRVANPRLWPRQLFRPLATEIRTLTGFELSAEVVDD